MRVLLPQGYKTEWRVFEVSSREQEDEAGVDELGVEDCSCNIFHLLALNVIADLADDNDIQLPQEYVHAYDDEGCQPRDPIQNSLVFIIGKAGIVFTSQDSIDLRRMLYAITHISPQAMILLNHFFVMKRYLPERIFVFKVLVACAIIASLVLAPNVHDLLFDVYEHDKNPEKYEENQSTCDNLVS